MSRRLRGVIPLSLVIALGALVSAPAAVAQVCGGTGTSASAVNQYCETIPTSSGPRAPHGGGQSLSSTLPSQVVSRISGSGSSAGGAATGASTGTVGSGSAKAGSKSGTAHRTSRRESKAARERQLLLSLPAAHVVPAHFKAAVTSVWSPYSWLLILLAGIGLALVALAVGVSRRHRVSDTTHTSD